MSSTATATVAGSPTASRRQINIVFAAILLGMLLAALDQTIVSTALPTIVADLGGAGHMTWVVTAYLLAETVATVLAGKFGDLFGRKLVFQVSTVVFVVGSALCGIATDMLVLIGARVVQGIGAGGLMVTAMALIADVIPLRDRGRYQGALGAVFGITTVVGPTLGGLFTDHLSWRWAFYINVPVAVVVLLLSARALPSLRSPGRPVIDYAGIGLIAAGASGLILALSWGGNEYEWDSPVIIGLFLAAVVTLAGFVAVERRAAEPMLPMHLFGNSVFVVCSALSFIVGFAMLGAMTFLPTYLQFVDGVSATDSGVRTLPMVAGLFLTSILSGTLISRTGRYKVYPIAGGAVMTLGLYLMSTMDRDTGTGWESLYMFVLGAGIGLSMQVLTIAVQNTVPYADLGTATSGVTFFRTLAARSARRCSAPSTATVWARSSALRSRPLRCRRPRRKARRRSGRCRSARRYRSSTRTPTASPTSFAGWCPWPPWRSSSPGCYGKSRCGTVPARRCRTWARGSPRRHPTTGSCNWNARSVTPSAGPAAATPWTTCWPSPAAH